MATHFFYFFKKIYDKIQASANIIFSLLIGFLAFILIADLSILNPQNLGWLMAGDPAGHYLGWQFFRNAPLWQWPFGLNTNYGMELGSSVVYTDSIPLLAFIFKPFSAWLSVDFQYFGIWILICFLLQSFFAWKLLAKFTGNIWLLLLGSSFFVLAPFFLWRLQIHLALAGQWLILAAYNLYFQKKFSNLFWIVLISVAALIHAYLLVMVLALWLADLLQRFLIKEINIYRIYAIFSLNAAAVIFVMWFAGYFVITTGINTIGYELFRMNILSPIDPDRNWSLLLNDIKNGTGDYEGFNYLGLGIIILSLLALYKFARNKKIILRKEILPISILCLVLFFYAITNRIAFGSFEIFQYNLPTFLKAITEIFRSPGRFFWPVSYLFYLGIFYLIFTKFNRRIAVVFCGLLLVVQIIDMQNIIFNLNNKFNNTANFSSPLRSSEWDLIAKNYSKLIIAQPISLPQEWIYLFDFAAIHKMKTNSGYFARNDFTQTENAQKKLSESLKYGLLDSEALYFFEEKEAWAHSSALIKKEDLAAYKDGFKFIAPAFKTFSDYDKINFTEY